MRQKKERADSSMNIKKIEKYKDVVYLLDFCSPSVWNILHFENVCERKNRRRGGMEYIPYLSISKLGNPNPQLKSYTFPFPQSVSAPFFQHQGQKGSEKRDSARSSLLVQQLRAHFLQGIFPDPFLHPTLAPIHLRPLSGAGV